MKLTGVVCSVKSVYGSGGVNDIEVRILDGTPMDRYVATIRVPAKLAPDFHVNAAVVINVETTTMMEPDDG